MKINEGTAIPKGYGIAWRDFIRNRAICFPIPFNWFAKWGREFWRFLMIPKYSWQEKMEAKYREIYDLQTLKMEQTIQKEVEQRLNDSIKLVVGAIYKGDE